MLIDAANEGNSSAARLINTVNHEVQIVQQIDRVLNKYVWIFSKAYKYSKLVRLISRAN